MKTWMDETVPAIFCSGEWYLDEAYLKTPEQLKTYPLDLLRRRMADILDGRMMLFAELIDAPLDSLYYRELLSGLGFLRRLEAVYSRIIKDTTTKVTYLEKCLTIETT